jgi:hypothetical protein
MRVNLGNQIKIDINGNGNIISIPQYPLTVYKHTPRPLWITPFLSFFSPSLPQVYLTSPLLGLIHTFQSNPSTWHFTEMLMSVRAASWL